MRGISKQLNEPHSTIARKLNLLLEENVVRAAGTVHCLNEEDIRRIITDSGFKPQRRNMRYERVN